MDLLSVGDSGSRFSPYVERLVSAIDRADLPSPLRDYCFGLLMPCERNARNRPRVEQQRKLLADVGRGFVATAAQSAATYVNAVDLDIAPAEMAAFLVAIKENGAATVKEPGCRQFDIMVEVRTTCFRMRSTTMRRP